MTAESLKHYGPCPAHPYSWHDLSRPCIRCLIAAAEQEGAALVVAGFEVMPAEVSQS